MEFAVAQFFCDPFVSSDILVDDNDCMRDEDVLLGIDAIGVVLRLGSARLLVDGVADIPD
jgi:hypothetical protein